MTQVTNEEKSDLLAGSALISNEEPLSLAPVKTNLPEVQSPMAMMLEAKKAGFDMEEIKQMMDLQDRNDARLAKQAFDKAMADFKKNPPVIKKDKENEQYESMYTSIGNMVSTVNEKMGPFGLNARWDFPEPTEPNMISVTCILAHELGHTERVTIKGPIDTGGAKNPLQQRKSARTYLKLETYEAVTGMASDEGNLDDDGNGAGPPVSKAVANNFNKNDFYPQDQFDKNFPAWAKKIESGAKTAQQMVDFLCKKQNLSENQINLLLGVK